ncbi:hypothetical protein OE749_11765 [Aestuariibacter sp. AA17]|uniref:Uncharacterized protein n=1 Tax=Fluctibacter corallii TaxID=2984329 RepID=A0ABT3A9M1_9ALTE|nr:hypothetical protein [Aestuariibacter sp. AA17]MCV2885371.1 hypothetical protein [Aestuariibacter sp. AA17]
MQEGITQNPERLVNALVRYRSDLLTPGFIEEHGTLAVDSIFRVLSINAGEAPSVLAEIPGTPFTREIAIEHIEVMNA